MSKYIIKGNNKLEGKVRIHGAKNAVLPILAASVASGCESVIHDCPYLSDVEESLEILEFLGCTTKREGSTVIINSEGLNKNEVPEKLMLKMRSSVIFLGALLARCKSAKITLPGGCEIGPRPIDLHLKALRQMGVEVTESGGFISCNGENIKSAEIHLDFPSVGATENIMLTALSAKGTTVIKNAAREPEIVDLENYLVKSGFSLKGAGSDTIYIEGAKEGKNSEHTIIPDRIEVATYASAILLTEGRGEILNVRTDHIDAFLSALKESGAYFKVSGDSLFVEYKKRLKAVKRVRTHPYPGFPTDMQSVFMSLMTKSEGTGIITENIFHDRFRHVDGLRRMGADIVTDANVAIIKGVDHLEGAYVSASDLRGGAALTIAALSARGESVVENLCFIDRGYEKFEENLRSLGADIQRR